jgi:hypothetical protein
MALSISISSQQYEGEHLAAREEQGEKTGSGRAYPCDRRQKMIENLIVP